MAGDFEPEPSLQSACINAIADKIELYMNQFPSKTASVPEKCPDRGFSGSVMSEAAETAEELPMDCDTPCVISPECDVRVRGDFDGIEGKGNLKMLESIASLEMQCHHDPPCGTSSEQDTKSKPQTQDLPDIFIPNPLSEEILKCICKRGKMDDRTAEFFADNTRFHVTRVYLKKAGHMTATGLKKLLSRHTLTHINLENVNEIRQNSPLKKNAEKKRITVVDLVTSVNAQTKEKLVSLNISGIPSDKEEWVPMAYYVHASQFKKLSILTNIRSLNVSYTNFTDTDLTAVIACMKHLQSLDISQTWVRSILYLGDMNAPKLRSLSMSNLDRLNMPKETLFDVLCKLSELRHLDISMEKKMQRSHSSSVVPNVNIAIGMVMVGGFPLPKLVSLDISGREGIEEVAFLNFYMNHPRLSFLGLLATGLDNLPCFTQENHPNFRPNMKVTGDGNEMQVLESLHRYHRRGMFAKDALFSLFHQTQVAPQYNREQLELVLSCMRNHRSRSDLSASVQMAATACVYNLTNREMGLKIPVTTLSKVVTETLATMENFQDKQQLQKNCLLTLCSDRILKEVKFDYFKTASLVMQCLCATEDPAMHRMSVAIISILAAKISTEQTAILGSSNYMKVLLQIVERKLNEHLFDLTLKFTLSALWNLTDESPSTCQNFIDNEGLGLFVRILEQVNADNPCLQTKVLGLLNNLAEVPALRWHLLKHDVQLIDSIRGLLHSEHIEVSYFAAGIISHLAMLDKETWEELTGIQGYRKTLLDDLYKCVLAWKPPRGEMVAYRTFKPFFPLLQRYDSPAMQLWAAWAVRHVCLKNGEKYQEMLVSEQGHECLVGVADNPELDQNVRDIIDSTLEHVRKNVNLEP